MADEAKARGNAAFSAGRFEEAVEHFTDAIKLAPDNHVLYRCARQPRALQVRPTTTCSTGAPDNHVLYRCARQPRALQQRSRSSLVLPVVLGSCRALSVNPVSHFLCLLPPAKVTCLASRRPPDRSNRSAAHASLHRYGDALADAERTVELRADWPKGYSRLGAALHGLRQYARAVEAFERGLALEPSSAVLQAGLADAKAAQAADEAGGEGGNPLAKAFQGPDFWARLHADPRARQHLSDPAFRATVSAVQSNPALLNAHLSDPRMMDVLGAALGISIRSAGSADEAAAFAAEGRGEEGGKGESRSGKEEKEKEKEAGGAEAMEEALTDEEREAKARRQEAVREKEAGNAAYKRKEFESAVEHYSKAVELDDSDVTFLTNRAAVFLEMGKYAECIADCDRAVERGREVHADFKVVARALTRKGTALVKQAKTAQDYEPAIAAFNKALTEHRNPDTLKKLNEAEKARKELEQQEYYDPVIADQEREKGTTSYAAYFENNEIGVKDSALRAPHCSACSSWLIEPDPFCATLPWSRQRGVQAAESYCNRAACYIKLGAMPEAKKDAEKCIALDESFVKGYLRKGAAEYFMKEYDHAMETYQQGLKVEPGNQELLDGIRSCVQQISKANRGDIAPEELKERQAKAMQDPEIQSILTDPVMRQVLTDFQENPQAAMQHQKNPMVMAKIQKLVAAGIVQVR
ncbi:unnamed protein product [Closterium sp. Naga37s-1]|nr:unnamed protein product [Closterium sp. Naga37s-1]